MSETFETLFQLLTTVVLPNLNAIEASQTEQRSQTDLLNRNLEEFRTEMHLRLTSIHADLAACRQELEDAMVTLRERDAEDADPAELRKKLRNIH